MTAHNNQFARNGQLSMTASACQIWQNLGTIIFKGLKKKEGHLSALIK